MTSDLALPFIAALIGVVSLFTDIKTKSGRVAASILGVLLVSACLFQIQKTYEDAQIKEVREARITSLVETLHNFKESAGKSLDKTVSSLDEILDLIHTSFGNQIKNPTAEQIKVSLEADKYRKELVIESTHDSRSSVTVQYFPKNVDGETVENALRELGFLDVKKGKPGIPSVSTNAIFYGHKVPLSSVKLVATTLIRAGVAIKHIRPFHESDGREMLIQVGAGTKYVSKPTLSLSMIREAGSFPIAN